MIILIILVKLRLISEKFKNFKSKPKPKYHQEDLVPILILSIILGLRQILTLKFILRQKLNPKKKLKKY